MSRQLVQDDNKQLEQVHKATLVLTLCAVVSMLGLAYLMFAPDFTPTSPLQRSASIVLPTAIPLLAGFITWALNWNLRLPPETERQQATIRNVIAFIIIIYLTAQHIYQGRISDRFSEIVAMAYYTVSWLFLAHIVAAPNRFVFPRRVAGMVTETGLLSIAFMGGGASIAPLWPMYLWTALGNGFRYGLPSLVITTSLALVGFAAATLVNPFWQASPWQTLGQFLALIVIPTYVSSLLRQLHAAKSQAEAANSAKTRFIAVMSHELRTPLSAMLGSVSVLGGSPLDSDQGHLAQVITRSGQSLLSMINELLDFSAIETGKTHFELRDVPIFDLLVDTVNTLTQAAEEKSLRLAVHADCRLPRLVRTDGEHVRRIVTNLVWNAIKFTRVGRIDVSFRLSADKGGLIIDVEDTGVGIPEDKQASIFDPFVQGDDRVERAYEGVGLGLAIVRELVSLQAGKISLKSRVNFGSRFTIELPIANAEGYETERDTPVEHRLAIVAGSGPLAVGGIVDACRTAGIACVFAESDPTLLRAALVAAKADAPLVFLSYRDSVSNDRVSPEQFEATVAMIETEKAIPVLVLAEGDDQAASEPFQMMVPATLRGSSQRQLANLLRIASLVSHKRVDANEVEYAAQKVCRILLVEDNATNRFITHRALSDGGHEVITAPSGEDALNELDRGTFDVVLTDINMPGLNGIEFTKIIKTINYSDNLRVIGLTADVTAETKRRCLEAGMDLVLTKPTPIATMLKAIDDLVERGVTSVASAKVTPIESSSRFRARRAPVFDESGFQRLKEIGDPNFILESLTLFLAEAVDLIAELESALDDHDRARAYDVFHSMKGICANVGALRLREVLNGLHNAENLVSDRHEHIKRLRDELGSFQMEATQRVPDLEIIPMPFG